MHSFVLIVGAVLFGKENYWEWARKVQHTLIFNDLWDGICEAEPKVDGTYTTPTKPTSDKELAVWLSIDKKAYALIADSINEEVSRHIISDKTSYVALKRLKDLFDSHSKLESM